MSEELQKDNLEQFEKLSKLKRKELLAYIRAIGQSRQTERRELHELIEVKKTLENKMELLIGNVAKWQNDKNILMNMLTKEFESQENTLMQSVISVVDDLESLLKLEYNETVHSIVKSTISHLLSKFSIEEIQTENVPFDYQKHIATGKAEKGENITRCMIKGYVRKSVVLRFATVLLD